MRFGTYYSLQAPPTLDHPEVIRREIEQMAWTEELGFDSIWLTEQPGFRTMAERMAKIAWEQLVAETLAFGSPDTVADKIAQLRDLGVGEVLCWMNFGGLPQPLVRRSMELFAREVLPRFR